MQHVLIACLHLFLLLDTCEFQSTFNLAQDRYDTIVILSLMNSHGCYQCEGTEWVVGI